MNVEEFEMTVKVKLKANGDVRRPSAEEVASKLFGAYISERGRGTVVVDGWPGGIVHLVGIEAIQKQEFRYRIHNSFTGGSYVPNAASYSSRAEAEQMGQAHVDKVQCEDRWSYSIEERDVTPWRES